MSSLSAPVAKEIYYFCDESSHLTPDCDYMAVAGLAVPDYRLKAITAHLMAIPKANSREVKWQNTSAGRDTAHIAYAEYLAELVHAGDVHLHLRFAPFKDYNHKLSGPAKRSDTTSKMHYQLLVHRPIALYGGLYKLHVRPDGGECTRRLASFRESMVKRAQRQYKRVKPDCVASIEPRDSKVEPLLQLLDVTLGAFAALKNKRHLNNSMQSAKRDLSLRIHQLYDSPELFGDALRDQMHFSIWDAFPRGPKNVPQLPGLGW